jgi:hypothetical protein
VTYTLRPPVEYRKLESDAESSIIAILAPGAYTAIAQGLNGGTEVGLIEVFALP